MLYSSRTKGNFEKWMSVVWVLQGGVLAAGCNDERQNQRTKLSCSLKNVQWHKFVLQRMSHPGKKKLTTRGQCWPTQ